jgi:hypothetical protein
MHKFLDDIEPFIGLGAFALVALLVIGTVVNIF